MLLSIIPKQKVAQLVRLPFFNKLMHLAIHLIVPQHKVGVALVALDEDERVFMLHHVFHPHVPWGIPGGWLQRDEDPAEGVLRELEEETGLTADLGPIVYLSRDSGPSHLTAVYLAKLHDGEPQFSGEIIEAKWFPIDEIPQPQYKFVEEAIQAALKLHRLMK